MTDVIVSRFVRYRLQWLCSFRYARMPVTCKLGTDYRTYIMSSACRTCIIEIVYLSVINKP